jgi:hypothetical protein
MGKRAVNTFLTNMKKAGLIGTILPWSIEGNSRNNKMDIRFAGLKISGDWLEIFSSKDNILMKFSVEKDDSWIDIYFANKLPFVKLFSKKLTDGDKWEPLIGELKRRLKKDKEAVINHTNGIGNLYSKIKENLK